MRIISSHPPFPGFNGETEGRQVPIRRILFGISAWISLCVFLALHRQVYAATDITFFAVSDTHYEAVVDSIQMSVVDNLNALPGSKYPLALGGGPVGIPRGVVMPGDLINRPYASWWKVFAADYGVNGEGRVKFPVWEGMGNHDVYNYGNGLTKNVITDILVKRNALRIGIANLDEKNYHYSWDWDQVHFVQLNLFAGSVLGTEPQWDPYNSLAFLKDDLEKHVGSSGRPVLVCSISAWTPTKTITRTSKKMPWSICLINTIASASSTGIRIAPRSTNTRISTFTMTAPRSREA
jgi:hypothetical protein